jgi:hypothetical protein
MNDLPIELECFLIKYGFFEKEHAPGYKAHTPVFIKQEEDIRSQRGWTPAYPGEEPPF